MKIYTKKGDSGQTSLGSGVRVPKNHVRVEAYGTIDELNAVLGTVVVSLGNKKYEKDLKKTLLLIQNDLFNIGSYLANPAQKKLLTKLPPHIELFEKQIDEMTLRLPPLMAFILPGGVESSSFLHLARTVVRRAERRLVALNNLEDIDPQALIYLNRLSDLFFTMARYANFKEKRKDTLWQHE